MASCHASAPGRPDGVVVSPHLTKSKVGTLWLVLVLVFVDLRMVFFGSPHLYIGGALFYLAIHLIKGAGQFGASGLYLYLLFVRALAIACYWRQSPSSERYIPGVEQIGVRRAGAP